MKTFGFLFCNYRFKRNAAQKRSDRRQFATRGKTETQYRQFNKITTGHTD